ncbi:MAG: hypothetical protein ACR2RD_16550 [Woeseiaceae bacterium]
MAGNTDDSYFGRLIGELQRRRVLRTAALYIVGAWLAMQVADVVFPALGISELAMRFVLFGAILGFPVALVFGWFYDLSAQGIRRTEAADVDASRGPQVLRRTDYAILSALGIVVLAILYNAIGGVVEAPRDRWEQDQDGPPMLAVLPFVATNPAGESESFAAGIHDDLLTQLAKIHSIRVISRTSVMEYRDTVRNIREIGAALGADTILEGGVQSAGNRIRINAQLIDARTDEHLWAETYDRELTVANIFEVQSEIARAITSAMRATLSEDDAATLAAIPTENMAAYRAFHRALDLRDRHGRTEDVVEALQEVVALDPQFTRAWTELVGSLSLLTFNRQDDNRERLLQAETALEHIRSIAPGSVDYVFALAYYTYYTLQDYERALVLIRRAQEMMPSDARLIDVESWIQRRQGDYDGRINTLRRGRTLDPNDPRWTNMLARDLLLTHHYEDALREIYAARDENYRRAFYGALLQIREHRDLSLVAGKIEALQTKFDISDDYSSLATAYVAGRDFQAAEGLLSLMPGDPGDPKTVQMYTAKLRHSVETYYFLDKQEELKLASSQMRSLIDSRRNSDGEFTNPYTILDLAMVEAVSGDTQEALKLVRHWERRAADDKAEFIFYGAQSCLVLGLAALAEEAVECLRVAFVEPSWAMPFIDPYLPYYDSIRDAPEFVELLSEIEDGLGNSQQ